jgi:hypothetical protein
MSNIILFESKKVRRIWSESDQRWYFAIADVISVLTDSIDPGAYWRKLKERLKKEGNETVTICHGLKMKAAGCKLFNAVHPLKLQKQMQAIPKIRDCFSKIVNCQFN